MTQGNTFSPIIFNMVVGAIIQHWVTVLALTGAGAEGLGDTIQKLTSFFYADGRLVALPRLERLHRALNFLKDLFSRVDLHIDVQKMVSMAFRPCYPCGGLLESAYTRQATGVAPSY